MAPKVASKEAGGAAPIRRVRRVVAAIPAPRRNLDGWLEVSYVEWLASHPGHPDAEIVRGLVRAIRSGEGWQ